MVTRGLIQTARDYVYALELSHVIYKSTMAELEFAGVFRADIVIAFDTYQAMQSARKIAAVYELPVQVVIQKNIFSDAYKKQQHISWWQSWLYTRALQNVDSIVAGSKLIQRTCAKQLPEMQAKISLRLQHFDISTYAHLSPSDVLQTRFPKYSVFVVFYGPLTHESGALDALDAVSPLFRYPAVSMVFLGEGPLQNEIERVARERGVLERVIINPHELTLEHVLPNAHILVQPGGTDAVVEVPLAAALAGVPVVAGDDSLVHELFVHNETALVCPVGDVTCLQTSLISLLNDNALRRRLARAAKAEVGERIEFNKDSYTVALYDSLLTILGRDDAESI
jgi:glycosyltransferase involved in cell wall biosynthesis